MFVDKDLLDILSYLNDKTSCALRARSPTSSGSSRPGKKKPGLSFLLQLANLSLPDSGAVPEGGSEAVAEGGSAEQSLCGTPSTGYSPVICPLLLVSSRI